MPSPFDCYMVLRGLKTLARAHAPARPERAQLAEWLASHPQVERVSYPGLASHPATRSPRSK